LPGRLQAAAGDPWYSVAPQPPAGGASDARSVEPPERGLGSVGSPERDLGLVGSPEGDLGLVGSPEGDLGLVGSPEGDLGLVGSPEGDHGLVGSPESDNRSVGSPRSDLGPVGSPKRDHRRAEPPKSESELAREICLSQLATRPRTRAELARAMAKRHISDEVIAEVLDRYDEVGIVDDAAFARAWVSSRHHGRGLARRALASELRRHGIDGEVAGAALETIDDDAEATAARALVDRKLRTATGSPEAVFRRLVGMLARKGYPPGTAIRAVKDALADRYAEAAELAEQIEAAELVEQADADARSDEATG